MSSISVLRDRLDGRRAAHAAADHDGVVAVRVRERVAARALETTIVVLLEAVVALQRSLLRPRLRIRCGEDRARGGRRARAMDLRSQSLRTRADDLMIEWPLDLDLK